MKLVKFPEHNVVFAKDQPAYLPLPAHIAKFSSDGRITCCWSLTWRERFAIFFSGVLWHQVLTFHKSLQPQLLLTIKPDMVTYPVPNPSSPKLEERGE